jgi:hypothetical protein
MVKSMRLSIDGYMEKEMNLPIGKFYNLHLYV